MRAVVKERRAQQTKTNIIAFFAHHGITLSTSSFKQVKVDRAYLFPTSAILAGIKHLRAQGIILPWNLSIGEHHLDGYDYRTAARGFRQNVFFCSCQIIIHEDEDGSAIAIEVDFDWFNPDMREGLYRVGSLLGHAGEFVGNRITGTKTNSIKVAKVLSKRGYPVIMV